MVLNVSMEAQTIIDMESKDNYFAFSLGEGDVVTIWVNGKEVTSIVVPYDGKLRCYMVGERRPAIQYKSRYPHGMPTPS
jgi:hypothetical protein